MVWVRLRHRRRPRRREPARVPDPASKRRIAVRARVPKPALDPAAGSGSWAATGSAAAVFGGFRRGGCVRLDSRIGLAGRCFRAAARSPAPAAPAGTTPRRPLFRGRPVAVGVGGLRRRFFRSGARGLFHGGLRGGLRRCLAAGATATRALLFALFAGRRVPGLRGLLWGRLRRRILGRVPRRRAHALDPHVGRDHAVVAEQDDPEAVPVLDVRQHGPLVVEDIEGDRARNGNRHFAQAMPNSLFLQRTQHLQRHRFGRAYKAGAPAMRAGLGAGLLQARTQPLARQLQQAEPADPADLDSRAIRLHRLFQTALHLAQMSRFLHVDEVDDDEPGQIAQPELAGDLVGRLDIGSDRGFLDIAFARRTARVDVDRDQRLGRLNDDVAARLQLHFGPVDRVELVLDLVSVEQRDVGLPVALDALGVARHQHPHEFLGGLIGVHPVDEHFFHVPGV